MPPEQDDGTTSMVGAQVPANVKNALIALAHERSGPYDRTALSDLVREALKDYLADNWEELPEEGKDLLESDLVADAGEDADVSQEGADA